MMTSYFHARAALAVGVTTWVLLAPPASAEPLSEVVRTLAAEALPEHLAISSVAITDSIRSAKRWSDVDPSQVAVDWVRPPREGRVSVRVSVGGQHPRRLWATLVLGHAFEVVVPTRDLAAGALLDDDSVRSVHHVGSARDRARLLGAIGEVRGARATRDLGAGQPIARQDVALAPPLARGTTVRVHARRRNLVVATQGELITAARPGQATSARLPTGATVRGTLNDRHTLLVEVP